MSTELLSEIFKMSLPSQREAVALGKMSPEASPWTLGGVCAKWRTIALDMACLWTSVILAIRTGPPKT